MGRRPDRSVGASACCGRLVVVIFIVCITLLVMMVATTSGAGVSLGPARAGGGVTTTTSSPGRNSGAGQVSEDAYRSSKRRIPKGPDPIHNRRAGKTTIAPRRRD